MPTENAYTRREFIQRGLTVVSTAGTIPLFLQQSAFALNDPADVPLVKSRPGAADDRILVVIQLGGGNDGLNTVVPFGEQPYYDSRPGIAIRQDNLLKFDKPDGLGLNRELAGIKELYDEGIVGIVQGVGYPNPNRSHFASMDIWHTADPDGKRKRDGWIGRYIDATCDGQGEAQDGCVVIGDQAPLATLGQKVQPVAFQNPKQLHWTGERPARDLAKVYESINRAGVLEGQPADTQAAFLMRTALDAQLASEQIEKAAAKRPLANYPNGNPLARSLRLIGSMIRSGLPTRVYYASLSGFDTHAGQPGRHGRLLRQLAQAVGAFYKDLKAQDNSSRVLVMTFSEFGRRVRQNAGQGTDHGTAAPMFIVGDPVRGGVHTSHPSLANLDGNGDLIFNTDFRRVYATVLDQWLKTDSRKVLGQRFSSLKLIG